MNKYENLMIGMLVRGLRTSLIEAVIVKDGKKYGKDCYYLQTKQDMTPYGIRGHNNSYWLGNGMDETMYNIINIVRDHAEKNVFAA